MTDKRIYEPKFVQELFDEMLATYGLVNLISSFGFCRRWRRQCIEQADLPRDSLVVDLMTGMGELCPGIAARIGTLGKLIAVDYSAAMCKKARQYQGSKLACEVDILEADALCSEIPDDTADVVISSFGLKTFSHEQINELAKEVQRLVFFRRNFRSAIAFATSALSSLSEAHHPGDRQNVHGKPRQLSHAWHIYCRVSQLPVCDAGFSCRRTNHRDAFPLFWLRNRVGRTKTELLTG